MHKEDLDKIESKIKEHDIALEKLKKLIPFGVLTMVAFSFVYPVLPLRKGQLTDWMSYPYSVLACLILFGLIYLIGYRMAVKSRKSKLLELQKQKEFQRHTDINLSTRQHINPN